MVIHSYVFLAYSFGFSMLPCFWVFY